MNVSNWISKLHWLFWHILNSKSQQKCTGKRNIWYQRMFENNTSKKKKEKIANDAFFFVSFLPFSLPLFPSLSSLFQIRPTLLAQLQLIQFIIYNQKPLIFSPCICNCNFAIRQALFNFTYTSHCRNENWFFFCHIYSEKNG